MSLLRWTDNYLVGHPQVDDEHRYLFALINEFHDAFSERHSRADLDRLLNRLVDYTERHFRHEEGLMRAVGYPDIERHMAIHERLVEQIFTLAEKFSDRAINPTRDTFAFLDTWLTDHILREDVAVGLFVAAAEKPDGKSAAKSAATPAEKP